jgi:hypothetical protein
MRTLKKQTPPKIPSVVLWREDLRGFDALVRSLVSGPVKLTDDNYEYDSIDEFFAKSGPEPRSLEFSAREPYVSIKLARSNPSIYIGDSNDFETIAYRIDEFLKARRLTFAWLYYWPAWTVPLQIGGLALSGTSIVLQPSAFTIWSFVFVFLAILAGFSFLTGRVALIRNYERRDRAFESVAKRQDLLNKFLIGASSVIAGILLKAAWDWISVS